MTNQPKTATITLDEYELDSLRDCLAQIIEATNHRIDTLTPCADYLTYGGKRYDEGVITACQRFLDRFDAELKKMYADTEAVSGSHDDTEGRNDTEHP